MLEFIQLLKHRYQSAIAQLDNKNPKYTEFQQRIDQLLYAEAFISKGRLIAETPDFPLQIAVIGPTQAGKSSIVNLLLNQQLAGVSPLAGFTVHPHGFGHKVKFAGLNGIQQYFGRFQCLDAAMLSRDRFDCYSITDSPQTSRLLPDCVCWDTPDFDSIDANEYREGVIRTIALADLIILVVSKEKYADQSVWEVMQTIADFNQPTLICFNKLNEIISNDLIKSLQDKWHQYRKEPLPEIIPLMFQKLGALPVWPQNFDQAIFKLAKKVAHQKHQSTQLQLINRYWQTWLAPVFAEHQAQHSWQVMVNQCVNQGLKNYQRDYLDHPYHYETFQKALVNLLNLLEMPGFTVLAKTRRILTWPARKLFGGNSSGSQADNNQEVAILNQIAEHIIIQLADRLLENNETEAQPVLWWKETAVVLRQQKFGILQEFNLAVNEYNADFKQDIENSAQRLYRKLQEQPLLLNSLRATRVSTDVAGMLLAIQAGGIGLHDLVLTPMMLSITSLLAESAIGSYIGKVEAELKQQQLSAVKKLFAECLQKNLEHLPELCHSQNRFNISEQACQLAEQALKEKKHGLRFL
jgi:GTP-binding protein EngB required for normal cell division